MEKIDLTKCVNCRFRAKVDGKGVEGRIAVDGDYLRFFYDNGDIYSIHIPFYWEHGKVDYFDDFEIVPRAPETYKDWQVGDIIWDSHESGDNGRIIFRSGDFVAADIDGCRCYTCEELFDDGYRLVLTDIEQKIIEESKKYEPQDGDVCYVEGKTDYQTIFISAPGSITSYYVSYGGPGSEMHLSIKKLAVKYSVMDDKSVKILRPATEDEKQKLFDAMAKEGKRWNAEKKVVEKISNSPEFKAKEVVMVRDAKERWKLMAFVAIGNGAYKYEVTNGEKFSAYKQCIPYNEETMHLLGTGEDYKEE